MKNEKWERFGSYARFALLGLLIAAVVDVLFTFIPFVSTFVGYLRIAAFAGAFFVAAFLRFKGNDKKPALIASVIAAAILWLIGSKLFALTPGVYVYCKVYSINWLLFLFPPMQYLTLYFLVVAYTYIFLLYMLSAWYEGRFKAAMRKVGIIAVAGLVLFYILSGVLNPSGGSAGGTNDKEKCSNCGGDGWDSANGCSCVWCGGDGRTSWNP